MINFVDYVKYDGIWLCFHKKCLNDQWVNRLVIGNTNNAID